MAKEKDFNNLIEKQDEETKKRAFEKLQAKLAENDDDISQPNQNVLVKKVFWQKRNIVIIGAVLLLIVVGVVLFVLLHKNNNTDNFRIRYCTASDYNIEDSEQTVKQYAEENNLDILYFDADNGFEILLSQQYKLNTTNEVICLYEEVVNSEYVITFFITDNLTEIDQLSRFYSSCKKSTQVKETDVFYGSDYENVYAKFEFKNYIYCIQISENTDTDYLLNLVAQLIN